MLFCDGGEYMKTFYFYKTNIGRIGIAESQGFITNLYFEADSVPKDVKTNETKLLKTAGKQILEYFSGRRKTFELPLAPAGTEFQKKVWQALCNIPYGETASYKDIAKNIGNDKACRAVGMANNKNPIAIIIPCHRVIGSNGKLVGYGGGLEIKKALLELENRNSLDGFYTL